MATYADLVTLDPALLALEALCRRAAPAANGDPDYAVFLTEIKPLVVALVGWHRGVGGLTDDLAHTVLSSSDAYDTVYHHLAAIIGGES